LWSAAGASGVFRRASNLIDFLAPGTSLTIPLGTVFQFRAEGGAPGIGGSIINLGALPGSVALLGSYSDYLRDVRGLEAKTRKGSAARCPPYAGVAGSPSRR
jgi:hypothetical protein